MPFLAASLPASSDRRKKILPLRLSFFFFFFGCAVDDLLYDLDDLFFLVFDVGISIGRCDF